MANDRYATKHRKGELLQKQLSQQSRDYQDALFRKEYYLMIPAPFYQLMTPNEVHVLAYLWNFRNVLEAVGKLEADGSFFCTSERFNRELGFNRQTLWRVLSQLQDRNYIRTTKRGIPPRRFVKLNRRLIVADVRRINRPDDDFDQT